MIDDPVPNPERDRVADGVAYAEKRVARAAVKRRAADREMEEALDALDGASKRLAAWDAANPEPQGCLRLVAA